MLQQHLNTPTDPVGSGKAATQTNARAKRPHRGRIVLALLLALVLIGTGVAGLARANPALVPAAVDLARTVFGPGPVAQVEAWAFQTEDQVRQVQFATTGAKSTVQWAAPATTLQSTHARSQSDPTTTTSAPASSVPTAAAGATAAPDSNASVSAAPSDDGGWAPFVTTATGLTVLERTIVAPDPTRPYVQAAVVRIDLRDARLHLVAGTTEPHSSVRMPRPGMIPAVDQQSGKVLAAFNGGFKAVNGAFGMQINGVTLLQPKNGLATLALFRDGSVRLGTWGDDIQANPNIVAYRQNCPLLVDNGALTAQAQTDDATLWGRTVGNKIATWRSGLGLSADGRYLIYVAGDGLTVPTLARALIQGGTHRPMQLDINSFWTRFVAFDTLSNGHLAAQKLTDGMAGDTHQFLVPDSRDFFYLTAR